jgi:hypothetical protein
MKPAIISNKGLETKMVQKVLQTSQFSLDPNVPCSDFREQAGFFCLQANIATLPQGQISIQVLEGDAWITHDKQDVLVYCGQTKQLPESKYPVLISAIHKNEALRYEVSELG